MAPYVGEIRLVAMNFAPAGWAFCHGQALPIGENETLFQLIGTTYGGDGEQTFHLPDLRSRVPISAGQGAGMSRNYINGETGGVEEVTLTQQQIPHHSHPLVVSGAPGTRDLAQDGLLATPPAVHPYGPAPAPAAEVAMANVRPEGGSQPHTNMQPYLALNFIISLFGVFPSPT